MAHVFGLGSWCPTIQGVWKSTVTVIASEAKQSLLSLKSILEARLLRSPATRSDTRNGEQGGLFQQSLHGGFLGLRTSCEESSVKQLCQNSTISMILAQQGRCYDHNCRTPMSTREKTEYCHRNQLTRGLVKEPGKWRWSSYNCYEGVAGVPLEIDSVEPA